MVNALINFLDELEALSMTYEKDQNVNAESCNTKKVDDCDFSKEINTTDIPSNNKDSGGIIDVDTGNLDIELTINRNFEEYSDNEQQKLLDAIKNLLELKGELKIKQKRKGSIKIKLELTPSQCEKLHWAIKSGALSEFDVVDSKIEEPKPISNRTNRIKRAKRSYRVIRLNKSELDKLDKSELNKLDKSELDT